MVEKRDPVGEPYHLTLQSDRHGPFRVARHTVEGLEREVQSFPVLFQLLADPDALQIVFEASGAERVQRSFSRVSVGCVTYIVSQAYRLGEVLVEHKGSGYGPCDLRYFQSVSHPGTVVVTLRRQEHLCLLFQPPE